MTSGKHADAAVASMQGTRGATVSRRAMLALSIPAGIALSAFVGIRQAQADIVSNHGDHTDHMDHGDGHTDLPHGDQNNVPDHWDGHHDETNHADVGNHCDVHCDWHDDHTDSSVTQHVDYRHADNTYDPPIHVDSTVHTDHNDTHNDDHGDIPHFDTVHNDASSSHWDFHFDSTQFNHTDSGTHTDGHTDVNLSHADTGYVGHDDVVHEDSAHYDHTDHTDYGA